MSVLTTLLNPPSQQSIFDNEVVVELANNGVSTTDWIIGSLTRAAGFTIAKLRSMVLEQVAVVAASGLGDYVFGFVPLPNATPQEQADCLAWAPIIAKQQYGVIQIPASQTTRTLTLTNASASAYNVPAGNVTVQFAATGNRYKNTAPYVSAGNDAVAVAFASEFAVDTAAGRSYVDSDGDTKRLITAQFPGVTVTASVLVAQGRDVETPQLIGARSRAVFPLINWSKDTAGNFVPPQALPLSAIESLTRQAFAFIAICKVRTSTTINDKIIVAIGQQGATATGPQVTAVQNFWNIYQGTTDVIAVVAALTQAITLGSVTITGKAAQKAAAIAEIKRRLGNYFAGVDQNRVLNAGGLIAHGYLVSLIETTAGVLGLGDVALTINGAAADYQLAADTIATFDNTQVDGFTWVNG